MTNLVELLLRVKPEWERTYLEYISELEEAPRLTTRDVNRLLDIFLESNITGESKTLRHLLDEWMEKPEEEPIDHISFEEYQQASLIPTMQTLHRIMRKVAYQRFTDEELPLIQDAMEAFFSQTIEYVAYKEAMDSLYRANKRQKEVKEELERLDESRAAFVSVAAHQLKTPLTLVEGYSQMLKEQIGEESTEAKPLLTGIESGTERMRELIDDLVDVAMIDNKMLSLYYQPIRLIDLIRDVVQQLKVQIDEKKIKLTVEDFEGSDMSVYADRERLEQALVEVVDNAIKYTPEQGDIFVGGRGLPGFMEITVKDSGVGIAAEDQSRIFDQFSRMAENTGQPSESGPPVGAGLGLHLSKGILEAHGGAIWVDSPGYDPENCPGSIFHLMIPAREEPPDDLSSRLRVRSRSQE